jgi:hypothetical protein
MRILLAVSLLLPLSWASTSWAEDKAPAKRPPVRRPPVVGVEKEPTAEPVANDCAVVTASASYVAYGYNHIITLTNSCKKAVECAVWTDIDPEPRTTLRLLPGESSELVTRRGSPARDVTAFKQCTFR